MPPCPRRFFSWSDPLLPAVAAHLLADEIAASPGSLDADLSQRVIVVRGRNAGRRLLGLLAGETQAAGRALVPPRIVTPGVLDRALFRQRETVAGRMAQRLAWDFAVKSAPPERLNAIWQAPGDEDRVMALGRFLDQTWQELSTTGADFSEAFDELAKLAPETADREEERWQALARLHADYRETLETWGLRDPADVRFRRMDSPAASFTLADPQAQVVLVNVIELPPVMVRLLETLPVPPQVFIHAPESEAAGFDDWGRLVAAYWERRPCRFDDAQIHVVADAAQQAARCAELIHGWANSGLPARAVAIAVPEPESMAVLCHTLEDAGIAARPAEGTPAKLAPPIRLLTALARLLEPAGKKREAGKPDRMGVPEPPLHAAVAEFIRHPDVEKHLGYHAKTLDDYYGEHLPWRLEIPEPEPENEAQTPDETTRRMAALLAKIRDLTRIRSDYFAEDVTQFLRDIYRDERELRQHDLEDRAIRHALEAIRAALDEMAALPSPILSGFPASALLRVLIEAAGKGNVPLPENPGAVELSGWLEAAADDTPALIVTSLFSGTLPEGMPAQPLLHDHLRERLGLPCSASRMARDQYTLWTVTESRKKTGDGNGDDTNAPRLFALIAPRRDASGSPTRPSRLLIAGERGEALARRLITLTNTPATTPMPSANAVAVEPKNAATGFAPPAPEPARIQAFRDFGVTGFNTWLASPRLFYWKHIQRLREADDTAEEMDAGMFGNVVHAVLRTFGEARLGREERPSAAEIEAELEPLLAAQMERQFGPHALPSLRGQRLVLWERLRFFAQHQSAAFAEGWQIIWVESPQLLAVPFPVRNGGREWPDVRLRGKIDRIDWHPGQARWRVIDYKTAASAKQPDAAHFKPAKASDEPQWLSLQLPLYTCLLPSIAPPIGSTSGFPVEPAHADLVYFNLPEEPQDAGFSEPFPPEMIPPACETAREIIAQILCGEGCDEPGDVHEIATWDGPVLAALCRAEPAPAAGFGEEDF